MIRALPIAVLLLLACNRADQPEAPTAAESGDLNDAEAMLNQLANEEGAAAEATAPSNSD